jgi:hypothetical protein
LVGINDFIGCERSRTKKHENTSYPSTICQPPGCQNRFASANRATDCSPLAAIFVYEFKIFTLTSVCWPRASDSSQPCSWLELAVMWRRACACLLLSHRASLQTSSLRCVLR